MADRTHQDVPEDPVFGVALAGREANNPACDGLSEASADGATESREKLTLGRLGTSRKKGRDGV